MRELCRLRSTARAEPAAEVGARKQKEGDPELRHPLQISLSPSYVLSPPFFPVPVYKSAPAPSNKEGRRDGYTSDRQASITKVINSPSLPLSSSSPCAKNSRSKNEIREAEEGGRRRVSNSDHVRETRAGLARSPAHGTS